MDRTKVNNYADSLIEFINFLNIDFPNQSEPSPYNNLGATIADAVLQSGLNYKIVVKPRIDRILKNYYEYTTLEDVINLIDRIGISDYLNWKISAKTFRYMSIIELLNNYDLQTESLLKKWLLNESNVSKLLQIYGVGNKTVDYLKLLLGIPSIPIDRHLFKFAKLANINVTDYADTKQIYITASDKLNVKHNTLDKAIWNFMCSL